MFILKDIKPSSNSKLLANPALLIIKRNNLKITAVFKTPNTKLNRLKNNQFREL